MLDAARPTETQEIFGEGEDDKAAQKLADDLADLIGRLAKEAEDRVSHRLPTEAEWIRDLEAYHSKYDPGTTARLNDESRTRRSKLYMGKTGEKTRAWVSSLEDILFPTDDKNWSIAPTPVPTLSRQAEAAVQAAEKLKLQAAGEAAQAAQEGQPEAPTPQTRAALSEAVAAAEKYTAMDQEARDRCDLMSQEMEDQLQESRYAAECRDVIEWACKIGTGITEGPVSNERARRGWREDGEGNFTLEVGGDPRPAYYCVSPFNFFPSKHASCVGDSEGFFVRHPWSAPKLRAFAKIAGVNVGAVRELLRMGPKDSAPDYMQRIRGLSGSSSQASGGDSVFLVWKYSGPLSAEDMAVLARSADDSDTAAEIAAADPLDETQCVVWFCGGKILKFSIYPYDSGEPMFTAFRFEADEGSFWGYGVPRLMRDDQRALNAAWRMMMDNSELSSAPQLFVDTNKISQQSGGFVLSGGGIWIPKGDAINTGFTGKEMFSVDIPSHQAELANIIEICRRSIDEITMTPQLAQGEQGTQVTQTAQGMALLMNSANTMKKRAVKNYDDDKTAPEIRRLYDWNMQFNPRPEIKGDYQVDARGSGALLVREMQARNLMVLAQVFAADPMVKQAELKRELFRSHLLVANRFIKTDTEIEQEASEQVEDPMLAIERDKLEIERDKIKEAAEASNDKVAIAEMEQDGRMRIAELNHETAMMSYSMQFNVRMEDIEARMQASRESARAKERSIAVEAALRSSASAPANTTQIANS